MGSEGLLAAILVVLLFTAGCGALPTESGDTTVRTVNPLLQSTPTVTATSNETTVQGARFDNSTPEALVRGHRAALQGKSYTYRVERIFEGPDETVLGRQTRIVRVNDTRRFVAIEAGGTNPEQVGIQPAETTVWTNDTIAVKRTVQPNGSTRYRMETAESFGVPKRPTGRPHILDALRGLNVSLDRMVTQDGQTAFQLRGFTERVDRNGEPDLQEVQLRMTITKTGVVRSFVLSYETKRDGTPVTVLVQFQVLAIDTTVVTRPDWYEAAANTTRTSVRFPGVGRM